MRRAVRRAVLPAAAVAAVGIAVQSFREMSPTGPEPPADPVTVDTTGAAPLGGDASDTARSAGSDAEPDTRIGDLPRQPVLLVPGWLDTARDLAALRIRFVAAGWPDGWVRAVTFEDPTGGNREHAEELRHAAEALLDETGADTLDIVAHSMGGLATRWYLLRADHVPVRSVAFIATPHAGTMAAHLAWGDGRDEMLPDSPFLDTLNAGGPVPDRVRAITVRTRIDTHVIPGESAILPGVPDHEVCCPTHAALPDDPEVFRIVARFLEGNGAAQPPPRPASGSGP